ncbi:MAG: hypothetical protein V1849_01385 [Chloroflexota bacterium]
MKFKFNTSLDINACQSRLRERIAKPGQQGTESQPLIMGRVRSRSFTIGVRSYIDVAGHNLVVKNPFSPICFGRFRTNQGQTIISGHIGAHPFIIAFFSIWFAGVIVIGGGAIASTAIGLAAGRQNADDLTSVCIVIGALLVSGIIMIVGLRGPSKEDSERLVKFIKTTFDVTIPSESVK